MVYPPKPLPRSSCSSLPYISHPLSPGRGSGINQAFPSMPASGLDTRHGREPLAQQQPEQRQQRQPEQQRQLQQQQPGGPRQRKRDACRLHLGIPKGVWTDEAETSYLGIPCVSSRSYSEKSSDMSRISSYDKLTLPAVPTQARAKVRCRKSLTYYRSRPKCIADEAVHRSYCTGTTCMSEMR